MLVSHFSSASKPAVLPRLHRSTNAAALSRASLRRSQHQSRGFRLVVRSPYYHRATISASRDVDILNRILMAHNEASILISFSRVAGIAGTVVCEKKPTIDFDLQKLKHDSNQAAVYLARATFTSNQSTRHEYPKPSQSYIAERNASRRIPRYVPQQTQNFDGVEYAIPVRTFSNYRLQFQKLNPPGATSSKESGDFSFSKPPTPTAQANSAPYVSDSELYLDGKTLEQELNPYYEAVKHNEPDGSPAEIPCPVREALKEFEARPGSNYDGFGYNEPDGKPPAEPRIIEEGLAEYDQSASYHGAKPFTFNEPDGLPVEPPSAVDNALNEYDMKPEANDYKSFAHNEPDGQLPQKPCEVHAALKEYDQKWEPKIENDNFFFDEDFKNELESIAATAPTTAAADATQGELMRTVPLRKIKTWTSAGFKKGRKESSDEKNARRAKLESDFEESAAEFARDIEAVRKSDKIRHAKEQVEQFEIEASLLLNQYHHLRGKIDARVEELEAEDKKSAGEHAKKGEVSTGGAAFSDATESSANSHLLKSGIDVRREEKVFSGGRRQRGWERRQRRGGKVKSVLGGAVAGAGVFYAAGVVSEFFTTGGSNGTGAVGL